MGIRKLNNKIKSNQKTNWKNKMDWTIMIIKIIIMITLKVKKYQNWMRIKVIILKW